MNSNEDRGNLERVSGPGEKKVAGLFEKLRGTAPAMPGKDSAFETIAAEASRRDEDSRVSFVFPVLALFLSAGSAGASFFAGSRILANAGITLAEALGATAVDAAGKAAAYMAPDELAIAAAIAISAISALGAMVIATTAGILGRLLATGRENDAKAAGATEVNCIRK